jgi:hypothetical protein
MGEMSNRLTRRSTGDAPDRRAGELDALDGEAA